MYVEPAEIERRKEKIYNELLNKTMTVDKLSEIIGIPKGKLVNTTRWLAHHNHLIMERVYDNSISRFVVQYTASHGMPFKARVKKTKKERLAEERVARNEERKRLEGMKPNNSNARVVRLLDNPLPSAPKSKKSAAHKGIGSSFSMYDYY